MNNDETLMLARLTQAENVRLKMLAYKFANALAMVLFETTESQLTAFTGMFKLEAKEILETADIAKEFISKFAKPPEETK